MRDLFNGIRRYLFNSGIARFYPSLLKEVDQYDSYCSNHQLIANCPIDWMNTYQAVINDSKGQKLFSLEWNISKIQQHLKDKLFPVYRINIEMEPIYCDESNLYYDRVQHYIDELNTQRLEPIFLVWIDFINMFYIIDGNHRFTASKICGRKTIDAIFLPARFHLNYMLSDESRIRYKIFHNIAVIQKLNINTKNVVSRDINDCNSLYNITDNKIRLGCLRYFFLFVFRLYMSITVKIYRTT